MKNSIAIAVLLLMANLVIPEGEGRLAPFPWPYPKSKPPVVHPKPHPKLLLTEECVKAKLELYTCVREKLAPVWHPKPLVSSCCDLIADLEKNCPPVIANFDVAHVPYFIRKPCSSAPSPK